MSRRVKVNKRDPEKRAAKRRRQREAQARSTQDTQPEPRQSKSQATHASNPKARRKIRDGERKMRNEREQQ